MRDCYKLIIEMYSFNINVPTMHTLDVLFLKSSNMENGTEISLIIPFLNIRLILPILIYFQHVWLTRN